MRKLPTLFFGIFVFLSIVIVSNANAQIPNMGLRHTDYTASEGYTLFTPENNAFTYLIDNCGNLVHQWEFSEKPGLSCYLLTNGNLLRAGKDSLEIRDWDNNLVWSYGTTAHLLNQHHDIEPLPNGNILCIVSDVLTATESDSLGRNPALGNGSLKLDRIVELEPMGQNSANVVWQWRLQDHLIQDFNPVKENFGSVSENPQLIDINYDNNQPMDYTHVNAIDYNVQLDQVLISVRHLSEIMIIDHSTTTAEAKGHSGGNSGMGGDIIWRWGNPEVYKISDASNRKLYEQHDAKWVREGCPDEGKISVFNNGGDGTGSFSSVHLIEPSVNGYQYNALNQMYLPTDYSWSWSGSVLGDSIVEIKKCGTQQQFNGNMLVCSSSLGEIFEIDPEGNVVWVYQNPSGSIIYTQNDTNIGADAIIFRGERYPSNYSAFDGVTLVPLGPIESENWLSDDCMLGDDDFNLDLISVVNPVHNELIIKGIVLPSDITILDVHGEIILQTQIENDAILTLDKVSTGMLFVEIKNDSASRQFKILHLD